MFIEGEIPKILSIASKEYEVNSPWWMFRQLEKSCRTEGILDNDKAAKIRSKWNPIQNEFYQSANFIAQEANQLKQNGDFKQMEELLTDYMNKNTNTVLSTLHNLLKV